MRKFHFGVELCVIPCHFVYTSTTVIGSIIWRTQLSQTDSSFAGVVDSEIILDSAFVVVAQQSSDFSQQFVAGATVSALPWEP